jgi:hypothetical protein
LSSSNPNSLGNFDNALGKKLMESIILIRHPGTSIQRGGRIQEELALELHAKAGVSLHQCGIEDV